MSFDLDAWKALFVEVDRILPDPAEMLKGCASLTDKAHGDVFELLLPVQGRGHAMCRSALAVCLDFYNFGAMCKGCWTSSSRSTTC